ncbi:hypothetical protein ES703_101158 [subsurface metagenome]
MAESVMRQAMETWLKDECADIGKAIFQPLSIIGHTYDKFMETGVVDKKSIDKAFDTLKWAKEKGILSSQELNLLSAPLGKAISDEAWRYLHTIYDKPKFISLFGEDVYEKTRYIGGGEIEISISDAKEALLTTLLEKVVECQIGERRHGEPRSDIERAMAHYKITEEEYLTNPEKYPLPERGAGQIEAKPTRFTKGQTIVIKSKAIYGWRAWATVERDDPEHNQVWVKEITPAVKYEDIEEED